MTPRVGDIRGHSVSFGKTEEERGPGCGLEGRERRGTVKEGQTEGEIETDIHTVGSQRRAQSSPEIALPEIRGSDVRNCLPPTGMSRCDK